MPRTPTRLTRAVVIVAAVAVIGTGTLAVATAMRPEERPAVREAAADAPTTTPAAEPNTIDRQVEQRRIFALRSDRAYVEQVAAASDTVSSDWTGLRLTPAEAAEFARQETLPAKLEEMRAILTPLGAFGGVWFDNPVAEPQVMAVAIVGELDADVRQRLLAIAGTDPLRFVAAERTEQELIDVLEAVGADPTAAGGATVELSVDVVANRVAVGVALDALADTEARLAAAHGDVLVFSRQPPGVAAVAGVG